jgi:hypothetical protein
MERLEAVSNLHGRLVIATTTIPFCYFVHIAGRVGVDR